MIVYKNIIKVKNIIIIKIEKEIDKNKWKVMQNNNEIIKYLKIFKEILKIKHFKGNCKIFF